MNIKCPDVPVLKLLLEEMATRRQHFFMPHGGNSGNESLRATPVSGWYAAAAAAAAAAKSLQACPTMCDPRDGSPPGSAAPGVLQARTPEWVAMSFSNA